MRYSQPGEIALTGPRTISTGFQRQGRRNDHRKPVGRRPRLLQPGEVRDRAGLFEHPAEQPHRGNDQQGEMVQVFVGPTKVAEIPKAVPEALLFDAVTFNLGGTAGPNDRMFVSNIKITRH